jgi:hypothetical protein
LSNLALGSSGLAQESKEMKSIHKELRFGDEWYCLWCTGQRLEAPDICPVSVGSASAVHTLHRTEGRRHRTFVRCMLRRQQREAEHRTVARVSHRTCPVTGDSQNREDRATGQSTRQGTGHLSGALKSTVACAQQSTVRGTGQLSGGPDSFVRCVFFS